MWGCHSVIHICDALATFRQEEMRLLGVREEPPIRLLSDACRLVCRTSRKLSAKLRGRSEGRETLLTQALGCPTLLESGQCPTCLPDLHASR